MSRPNDEKGKGRASDDAASYPNASDANGQDQSMSSSPSMTTRIGASVAALVRDGFITPKGSSLAGALAASQDSAGKGQASTSARDRSNGAEWTQTGQIPGSSTGHARDGKTSIRSVDAGVIKSAEADYNAFLESGSRTDTTAMANPSRPIPSQAPSDWLSDYGVQNHSTMEHPTHQSRINPADGAEVVALLSAPDVVSTPPREAFLVDDEIDPADLFTQDIPSSALPTLEKLKAEMLPPPPTYTVRTASDKSRDRWLQDWEGFLNRYSDEVWGDMLPLVTEAREEVEMAQAGGGHIGMDGSAVKRLGMILGHLNMGN